MNERGGVGCALVVITLVAVVALAMLVSAVNCIQNPPADAMYKQYSLSEAYLIFDKAILDSVGRGSDQSRRELRWMRNGQLTHFGRNSRMNVLEDMSGPWVKVRIVSGHGKGLEGWAPKSSLTRLRKTRNGPYFNQQ